MGKVIEKRGLKVNNSFLCVFVFEILVIHKSRKTKRNKASLGEKHLSSNFLHKTKPWWQGRRKGRVFVVWLLALAAAAAAEIHTHPLAWLPSLLSIRSCILSNALLLLTTWERRSFACLLCCIQHLWTISVQVYPTSVHDDNSSFFVAKKKKKGPVSLH